MEYIHVRNLDKYNPGYKDRGLIWCKIYFTMLNSDYDFDNIDDVDKWRLIAIIMLEIQMKKPIPYDEKWLLKKISTHTRPIHKTIQMLHNFLEVVTDDLKVCTVEKRREEKIIEDKNTYAEHVKMTEIEYQTLIKDYGVSVTTKMIVCLSNYKGAHGKTYKSDYRAILSWVVDKVGAKKIYSDVAQVKTETPTQRVNNQPKLRRHEPRDPEDIKKVKELIDSITKKKEM